MTYLKLRHRNGRKTTRWYVCVPVPKDLQPTYRKRTVEVALNTDSLKEARQKRFPVVSKIFEDFERARSRRITSAQIEEEARAYCEQRIAELRRDQANLSGVGEEEREALKTNNDAIFVKLMELQQLKEPPPHIFQTAKKIVSQKYGLELRDGDEQLQELATALLRAEVQAVSRFISVRDGEKVEPLPVLNPRAMNPVTGQVLIPEPKAIRVVAGGMGIEEAVNAYIAEHSRLAQNKWTEKTCHQVEQTTRLFADFMKNAPLPVAKRPDVAAFLDTLATLSPRYGHARKDKTLSLEQLLKKYPASDGSGLSNKTLKRHNTTLVGLFDWAIRRGKYEGENPARNVRRWRNSSGQLSTKIRPFRPEELRKLIGSFTSFITREKLIHPAEPTYEVTLVWLFFIALYSGMRLEEMCSLTVEDVKYENEGLTFHVRPLERRRYKNDNAVRLVPVHSELLRIGFKHYLTFVTKQGEERLFPILQPGSMDGRYGEYISKRFTVYRRRVGITERATVFHSTRKNASTALRKAGIDESEAAMVIGHEHEKMTYGTYAPELDLPDRKRVVEAIQYPCISLGWLYERQIIGLPHSKPHSENRPT